MQEWCDLCQAMRDMAEGYAATDSINGWLYRSEASQFCDEGTPADDHELALRRAIAATLRQRWAARLAAASNS